MAAPVLTCVEYDATTNTCTVQAWMEPPTLLPALTVGEAMDIAQVALLAFASVMAVKLALRKSQ